MPKSRIRDIHVSLQLQHTVHIEILRRKISIQSLTSCKTIAYYNSNQSNGETLTTVNSFRTLHSKRASYECDANAEHMGFPFELSMRCN